MARIIQKVLDISSYQGVLTDDAVAKIKAQNMGVIIRLGFTGYGSEQPSLDSCFEKNYEKLHGAGVPCGAYYFTLAYNDRITDLEIAFIKNQLANRLFEFPIYLDVEAQTKSAGWTRCTPQTRSKNVARICKALQDDKYYVGIYASKSWFGSQLIESEIAPYDKWVAQYNIVCTYGGKYNMWQYSSTEKASKYGITKTASVDISNAYLNFPEIIKSNGLNNYDGRKYIVCPHCGKRIYT